MTDASNVVAEVEALQREAGFPEETYIPDDLYWRFAKEIPPGMRFHRNDDTENYVFPLFSQKHGSMNSIVRPLSTRKYVLESAA